MTMRSLNIATLGLIFGLTVAAGDARADAAETLIEQCHIQLEMTDSGCDCIGNSARSDLTETQQEFVVAQVTDDQAAVQELQGGMTVDEMTEAAEWMMSIPVTCEQQ